MPAFGAPEQVTLVNEAGETIGHMERTAMGPDDMCLAAVAWLTNRRNEVLVAQRANTPVNPYLWSVGCEGIVTYGDTAEETIVREIPEELGVHGVILTPVEGCIMHGSTRGKRFKRGFKGEINTPVEEMTLQTEEVAQALYVPIPELVADWRTNPKKYVGHFGQYLELFGII